MDYDENGNSISHKRGAIKRTIEGTNRFLKKNLNYDENGISDIYKLSRISQELSHRYNTRIGDESKNSVVYLLYSEPLNLIKIGSSCNLDKRLHNLELEGIIISKVKIYKSNQKDCLELENKLHRKYIDYNRFIDKNISGYTEWFSLEIKDELFNDSKFNDYTVR